MARWLFCGRLWPGGAFIVQDFSESTLLGAGDDLVLELFPDVDEVVAVPGDSDDEVPVLLRVLLSLFQGFCIDDIELQVVCVVEEVGTDHFGELRC